MSVIEFRIITCLLLIKFYLVEGQWNSRGYYTNQGLRSSSSCKLPIQYVPAQTASNQPNCYQYPTQDPYPQNIPYPNGPYPPYPSSYPGDVSIQPSYPGQPVIVINNGGRDGPGGGDSDFDIGELLTLMLAFNGGGLLGHGHHGHGHHSQPTQEAPKDEPDQPMYPPWFYGYPGPYPGMNGYYPGYFPGTDADVPEGFKPCKENSNKSGGSINITIVLPNNASGSTNVQVDTKNKDVDSKKCEIDKDECKED